MYITKVPEILALCLLMTLQDSGEAASKPWPYFDCWPLPNIKNPQVADDVKTIFTDRWNWCLKGEEETGACAKICSLITGGLMYEEEPNYVVIDAEIFTEFMQYVIMMFKGSRQATGHVDPYNSANKCIEKHPVSHDMWKHTNSSCEIWEPMLECIDHALMQVTDICDEKTNVLKKLSPHLHY